MTEQTGASKKSREDYRANEFSRSGELLKLLKDLQSLEYIPNDLSGLHALDIGTEYGDGVIALKNLGATARGIEGKPHIVAEVISKGKLTGEEIRQGYAPEALQQYKDGEFDLITIFDVPVLDRQATLRESARLLKEDGRVIFTTGYHEFRELKELETLLSDPQSELSKLGYTKKAGGKLPTPTYVEAYYLILRKTSI